MPGNTIHMYGGDQVAGRVESAMVGQMESPSFPVRLDQLPAKLLFHDLHSGAVVEPSRVFGFAAPPAITPAESSPTASNTEAVRSST